MHYVDTAMYSVDESRHPVGKQNSCLGSSHNNRDGSNHSENGGQDLGLLSGLLSSLSIGTDGGNNRSGGERTRYSKSRKSNSSGSGQQQTIVEGKAVRILQRPSSVTLDLDKQSNDADFPTLQGSKRGHRKKTLSLNPEEREALESLIEEVIIGGFEEAIINSDESSDDGDNSNNREFQQISKGSQFGKAPRHNISLNKNNNKDLGHSSLNTGVSGRSSDKSYLNDSGKALRNNIKDINKWKENNFKAKDCHGISDFSRQKNCSPVSDKDQLSSVQGVNIYPAQLKVAIKHMDSLPPRFLRRLQAGQCRFGNETPVFSRGLDSPKIEEAVESDREKSKQTQLQETKKTIRTLLCNLDQYIEEGIATPNNKDVLSNLNFLDIAEESTTTKDRAFTTENSFDIGANYGGYGGVSQNLFRNYSSDSIFVGNQVARPLYLNHETMQNDPSVNPQQRSYLPLMNKQVFNLAEVEEFLQASSKNTPNVSGMMMTSNSGGMQNLVTSQSSPVGKKTQFSVTAPEFVSNLFTPDRHCETLMNGNSRFGPGAHQAVPSMSPNFQFVGTQYVPHVLAFNPLDIQSMENESSLKAAPPSAPSFIQPQLSAFNNTSQLSSPFVASKQMSPASREMYPPGAFGMNMVTQFPPYHMQPFISNNYNASLVGYPPSDKFVPGYVPPQPPQWFPDVGIQSNVQPSFGWFPEAPQNCSYLQNNQVKSDVPQSLYMGNSSAQPEQQVTDVTDSNDGWSYNNSAPSQMESSCQKITQLVNDGVYTFVILVGALDKQKMALISELQCISNSVIFSGARNGFHPNFCEMAEFPKWNLVQGALKERPNLIVIDLTTCQPWDVQNYTELAQQYSYLVEIVGLNDTVQYANEGLDGTTYAFNGEYCDPYSIGELGLVDESFLADELMHPQTKGIMNESTPIIPDVCCPWNQHQSLTPKVLQDLVFLNEHRSKASNGFQAPQQLSQNKWNTVPEPI